MMSLTPEEQASLKRLRKYKNVRRVPTGEYQSGEYWDAVWTAVDIALREHQDDAEDITEEWFHAAELDIIQRFRFLCRNGKVFAYGIQPGHRTDFFIATFTTRSAVRQFCQSLGIELTASPPREDL